MNRLSVSIIVPVYNSEDYLKVCIDSLINQTYKNLTIILVNDCSTDNSIAILRDYECKYPGKIKVIDSITNRKPGGARNLGIRASTSDYIGFVDSDDFVQPQMYKLLMEEAEVNESDAVYCSYKRFYDSDNIKNITNNYSSFRQQKKVVKNITAEERMNMIATHQFGSVCGGIYRRSIIEKNNLFFPEQLAYEDNYWAYTFQMLLDSASFISQKCYYYRQRNESTTHTKNSLYHYDRIEIGQRLLQFFKEKGLFNQYQSIIEYLFIDVFTINTFIIFVCLFDKPSANKIQQVKSALVKEFPQWRNNKYYKKETPISKKIALNILMALPSPWFIKLATTVVSKLWSLKSRILKPN